MCITATTLASTGRTRQVLPQGSSSAWPQFGSAPSQALLQGFSLLDSESRPSKNRQVNPKTVCGHRDLVSFCKWWVMGSEHRLSLVVFSVLA